MIFPQKDLRLPLLTSLLHTGSIRHWFMGSGKLIPMLICRPGDIRAQGRQRSASKFARHLAPHLLLLPCKGLALQSRQVKNV